MDFLLLRQVFSDRWLRNVSLMIFVILCANKFDFQLTGGEEQYVAFAKQFIDPNWIPNSFTLTEFAGTRWLFQIVNTPLVYVFDIENAALVGRLINFFFFSIPLALIFRKLQFRWELVFFVVQLFVMGKQSFFGGEWIFDGYEPKSVAYIFLFYGFYYALEKDLLRSSIFLAIATYFHVLVGGWFFLCLGGIYLFSRPSGMLKQFVLPYFLLCLPFAIYLFSGYFSNGDFTSEYDLDRVYCYYRLKHHVGIFYSEEYFMKHHFGGVLATALVLTISVVLRKHIPSRLKLAANIMFVALSINLIFVGIAWLDVNMMDYRLASILKYYPFRTNSIAMFMLFMIVAAVLWKKFVSDERRGMVSKALVVISIILAITQIVNSFVLYHKSKLPEGYVEMCRYIQDNTDHDASFVLINIPLNQLSQYQFIRRTERESFSVYKFVPAEKQKLDEWYTRQQLLKRINTRNDRLSELDDLYEVNYALSDKPIEGYELTEQIGVMYLYRLSE